MPGKAKVAVRRLALGFTAFATFVGCGRAPVERVEWPVMGTVAAVQTRGGEAREIREIVGAVQRDFAAIERLLNAHEPTSEICRLASLSEEDALSRCDPSVRACYEAAFRLERETAGAFNPHWRGPGTLDLGAIAKGFAVDVAASRVGGRADLLIDLGGNLKAVRGDWSVGVYGGESFVLREGEACATSATYFRGNHIVDGRTGVAVTNVTGSVTVIHPSSATLADGLSTALFVLGVEAGERYRTTHHPDVRVLLTP